MARERDRQILSESLIYGQIYERTVLLVVGILLHRVIHFFLLLI